MTIIARVFCLLLVVMLSACGRANFAAVNVPTHFNGTDVHQDVMFGPSPWQKLDIYMPKEPRDTHDVIVFYYGGRWQGGTKEQYRFVGSALASRGYIVVIPDYRKYPQVRFPVFVEDAAWSLAWIYDHIGVYGGNKNRIHLSGHSAGAHIAALLATDARYLKGQGKERNIIHDFVGLGGPYAFVPDEADLKAIFAPPSNYPNMMASNFIDGHQPPMLLLWGDADQAVGKFNMDRMMDASAAYGGMMKTKIYPGVDHAGILKGLTWVGSKDAPVLDDMDRFFSQRY